jgi:hypothetical protein
MKLIQILFVTSLLISASACKKDEPVPPQITDPCQSTSAQELKLEFKMTFGDLQFRKNFSYQLNDTTYISFREARIYFCNIKLQNSSGLIQVPQDVILVDDESFNFYLGNLMPDTYTGLQLSLGIDSARNHLDASQYAPENPLALQVPSMYWGWNQGYIFALLEGNYSNTPISQANPGSPWFFHIGLDGNFQQSNIKPMNFQIKACQENKLNLSIDMAQVFNDIDIFTENSGVTTDNFGLSYRVGTNLINAISNEN